MAWRQSTPDRVSTRLCLVILRAPRVARCAGVALLAQPPHQLHGPQLPQLPQSLYAPLALPHDVGHHGLIHCPRPAAAAYGGPKKHAFEPHCKASALVALSLGGHSGHVSTSSYIPSPRLLLRTVVPGPRSPQCVAVLHSYCDGVKLPANLTHTRDRGCFVFVDSLSESTLAEAPVRASARVLGEQLEWYCTQLSSAAAEGQQQWRELEQSAAGVGVWQERPYYNKDFCGFLPCIDNKQSDWGSTFAAARAGREVVVRVVVRSVCAG